MFAAIFTIMLFVFIGLVSKPEQWLSRWVQFLREQNIHNG
ncbi:MAG: hypothetical protein BWY02_02577 [bacterium ADurb.Bin157]|nr:MAG: hypothetical protein BWY02_02577 [bacterium ADurb.Bin157]